MANRNRYDDRGDEGRGDFKRRERRNSDFDRGNYGAGRAGSYGHDREESYGGHGSSDSDSDDDKYSRRSGRSDMRGTGRGRDQERGNYGDLGGSYSNSSDQGEYGGGYYSGRADYDEDYEDYRESDRFDARGNYSSERGGSGNQSRGGTHSSRNRLGGEGFYGQGGMNDYGGGGTYGGYRDRDYSRRGNFGGNREGFGGNNRARREDYDEHEERGRLERAGDEAASWLGFGEVDRNQGRHRGRGPRNYKRSDERIKEDINDRLTDDYHLDASDIDVEVSEGDVILSGTVDSRRAKRRAEDIAEDVSGVRNVENRLRVNQRDYSSGHQGGSPYDQRRLSDTGVSNLTNMPGTSSTSGISTDVTGSTTGTTDADHSDENSETGTSTGSTSGTTGGRNRPKSG